MVDIIKAGHELGNHAMHDEASRSLTDTELLSQVLTVQSYIAKAYEISNVTQPVTRDGKRLFRPGSGFFSTRMRELLGRINYRIALGGIYPHDPQIPYAWVNARHVLSMVRTGGIVICHDRRAWTVPMLETVLPDLERRGYMVKGLYRTLGEVENG